MLGKYSNEKIKRNLLVVKILSAVSIGYAVMVGIMNCFDLLHFNSMMTAFGMGMTDKILFLIFFYLMLIFVPLSVLISASGGFVGLSKRWKQTPTNNDIVSFIMLVLMTLLPFLLLFFGICFGMPWIYFG